MKPFFQGRSWQRVVFVLGIIIILSMLMAGCEGSITGKVVSEQGCQRTEQWCSSLGKCLDPWDHYCPREGEHVELITATECELVRHGRPVNIGAGNFCDDDEHVEGELAGLVSLHVCCVKNSS